MYLMGGLNIVNSGGSAKDPEIAFTSDNADTFIAGDASKTLTLKGALHTRGTVNIGYSLDIKGTNKVDGMENRGVGLCVLSGTTNIGGNVSLNDGEDVYKRQILGMFALVNSDFVTPMFHEKIGIILLCVAGGLELLCFLLIKKITTIKM